MTKKKFGIGCGTVLGILITVIVISALIANRPSPAPDETALEVELIEAEGKGLIDVSAYGAGSLEWVNLNITSRSDAPLKVTILPGTIFEPQSASVQSMVVRKERVVVVEPGATTESKRVAVACANMRRDMPGESDNLTLGISRASPDLVALLNLPDFHKEPFRIQQFAIWTITDNPECDQYVGVGLYGMGASPDDDEMTKIRVTFEKAGISIDKYRALR